MKVYIVMAGIYDASDMEETIIEVFLDEGKAKKYVEGLEAIGPTFYTYWVDPWGVVE